jgi:hypothetical protein
MRWTALALCCLCAVSVAFAQPPRVEVSADHKGFVLASSGKPFIPWGFNYDRDYKSRLLEDYWDAEWATVEQDFAEMKQLGANVVRVHLQFARFMDAPDRPNEASLAQLTRLLDLAEHLGLYLDLIGLGCYRKQDVPAWYDALDEPQRWIAQANFWEAIAKTCANRAGVFCFDLINEPVIPLKKLQPGGWVHPIALGGFHYLQHITLDLAGRDATAVAQQWTKQMIAAVRKHDRDRLITIGLLPIEANKMSKSSGFVPAKLAPLLDYMSVHIYPAAGKTDDALATLRGFHVGKPLVVEETFPMSTSARELGDFIGRSRGIADGWIGFYWGQTPAELRGSKAKGD